MQCPKPDCMYLHELGDEAASFTKEEMQVRAVSIFLSTICTKCCCFHLGINVCVCVCVCLCVCLHSGGKASRIRTETPPGSLQTEPSLRADLNHRQREDEGQVQLHTEVPHQPAPWPITTPHLTAQHNTTRHSGKLVQTV